MYATVRPKYIYEALIYIIEKELYRKYNITIDDDLIELYLQHKEEMSFLIDPDDKDVLEKVIEKTGETPTSDTHIKRGVYNLL